MKVSINWLKELVDLKVPVEDLIKVLNLKTIGTKEVTEQFIELDMKGYNRADLLSMRGVAIEAGAITDSAITFKDEEAKTPEGLPEVKVTVENSDLCPIYCVAKIENLKVEQSSEAWVKKLSECGMRPVNNLADVTNLIMLEYGQPLHAFDAGQVSGEEIVVRTAKNDEKIITLDGKERELESTDLLIADPERAIGIAGVMGGKDSEITEGTTTILLEAAIFDPASLRKTATRLGLQSEASKRFYHGLTKKRLFQALQQAILMYESLGGKVTGISIVGSAEDPQKTIKLTQKKVNELIGVDIEPSFVESCLKKLQFGVGATDGGWEVTVPYFRLDIEIEEDLVEEVARMYGYEKIPAKALEGELPEKIDQSLFNSIYEIKKQLCELGLTEVQTYSFYSTQVLNALGFNEESKKELIKIANPISSETEYLRRDLWPNLVEVVGKNIKQGFEDIAIFEIGKVYNLEEGQIKEGYRIAIALMNGSDNPTAELAQMIKVITEKRGLNVTFKPDEAPLPLYHPKRFAYVQENGETKFGFSEIHPRVLNEYGISKRVAITELDLETLL